MACNLAVLLGVLCRRPTLLLDVNMNGGHVWLHMGLKHKRGNLFSLAQVFKDAGNRLSPRDLDGQVVRYGDTELDVLLGIARVEQAGGKELCGEKGAQGAAFTKALLDLARRKYDFVIVDLGSSLNSAVHLTALQEADRVLLVVTPDRTGLFDARAAVETLVTGLGFTREHFWLVVNMYTEEAGLARREIPTWLELVEMGLIPLDPTGRLFRSANTGTPFVMEYMQQKNPDADVEALLEGFAGVAASIYPPFRPVWEDRRKRMRAARPRKAGLLDRLMGQPA
jgi:MinD-like ATPase involved in chromosome partitioning or flagellar assembly